MNYWPSEQTIVTEYQVMTIPWDELLTKWANKINEYQVMTIPWDELLTKWTNNSYWISSNDNTMRWIIDQVSKQ